MIINIVGGSGAGKTSIVRKAIERTLIPEIVSITTRPKRKHEIEGLDYYFVSKEELEKYPENSFVERSEYSGCYYGILKEEISKKLALKDKAIVITDTNGNRILKEYYGESEVTTVFIMIDEDMIRDRMVKRGDSEEKITERINNFVKTKEFYNYKIADYVIWNKDFDKSVNQLVIIINQLT